MSRSPASSLAVSVAMTCALGGLAGCGGSTADPDSGGLESPVDPSPSTSAPATPAATPTTSPKASPSATASADDGGDGDAEGDDSPSTAGGGVCRYVGAEEVGAVLGGITMRGSAVPGQTGCTFDQGGKRGMSVTILDRSTSQAGGMTGAKAEANSAVEGTPQDLSGIGSAAFVITGAMFGGPDVNAAGAVQLGRRIVSVLLEQRSGLAESRVRTSEVDLLKLVVTESS